MVGFGVLDFWGNTSVSQTLPQIFHLNQRSTKIVRPVTSRCIDGKPRVKTVESLSVFLVYVIHHRYSKVTITNAEQYLICCMTLEAFLSSWLTVTLDRASTTCIPYGYYGTSRLWPSYYRKIPYLISNPSAYQRHSGFIFDLSPYNVDPRTPVISYTYPAQVWTTHYI